MEPLASCLYPWLTWIIFFIPVYLTLDYLIRLPYIKRKGKFILITGCDRGFGYETAVRLDNAGCHVFAGCLTEQGRIKLEKECSRRLITLSLDVTELRSIQRAYETVKSGLPNDTYLWGLVNNAGILGKVGPCAWLQKSDYDEVLAVNLFGTIQVTQTFLPLIKMAEGRIVNTSSVMGRMASSQSKAYCISKFGLEAFSDILRRELRPYNCSVHIIEPGHFKTMLGTVDMRRTNLTFLWERLSHELQDEYGHKYFDDTLQSFETKRAPNSDRISDVVDAYEHALLGAFPRPRYLVGMDAKLYYRPLELLPEWLADYIIWRKAGGNGAPVPAMCVNKGVTSH